jgi:hypothetical protein
MRGRSVHAGYPREWIKIRAGAARRAGVRNQRTSPNGATAQNSREILIATVVHSVGQMEGELNGWFVGFRGPCY